MRKKWVVIAAIILICIGGVYWMLKPTEDEKILAENEKFTSQFISDVPEEKDFKRFNSKTEKYSMLYPNEFYMIDTFYYIEEDYENWMAERTDYVEKKEVSGKVLQTTYRGNREKRTQGKLNIMLNDVSYDGQHKKMTVDHKTIYYGQSHFVEKNNKTEILDPKKHNPNHFFAFVVDNETQQFVEIIYSLYCFDEKACTINAKEEEEFFEKMYKSVEFK
jgi:hypothetical protein